MKQPYFGFYWTYPVPWVGFTELPEEVDEAAKKSITIRYSRRVVHLEVARLGGKITREVARMEIQPDRASKWLAEEFSKLLDEARSEGAYVAIVVFSAHRKWRGHTPLSELYGQEPCYPIRLSHDDLPNEVDPYAHFSQWRRWDEHRIAENIVAKPLHREEVLAASRAYPDHISFVDRAARLNAEGLRTFTGRHWTDTNLKKFLSLDRPPGEI